MKAFVALFLMAMNSMACDKADRISSDGSEIFVSCPIINKASDNDVSEITYKLVVSGQFDNTNDFDIYYTSEVAGDIIATYSSNENIVTFETPSPAPLRQIVLRI